MAQVGRVLVLCASLGISVLGLVGGTAMVGLAFLSSGEDFPAIVLYGTSIAGVCLCLGLPLAWHSGRALKGSPSAQFTVRRVWPFGAAFALALLLGQGVLTLGWVPVLVLAPLHLAAAALPSIIIVVLVARGLAVTTTWRDLVLQLSAGAFAATFLAFIFEGLVIFGLVLAALLGLALRPGGAELVRDVSLILRDPNWVEGFLLDPGSFLSLPLVGAIVFVIAGIVPATEELLKPIGLVLSLYRRPSRPQAFLWGMAGGAGFAILEGALNTANTLDAWLLVMSLRVGATLLHCLTGSLMGLAWHSAAVNREWPRAVLLYVVSVSIHAVWNLASLGLSALSVGVPAGGTDPGRATAPGLGPLALLAFLVLLVSAMVLALWRLTAHVRLHAPVGRPSLAEGSPEALPGPVSD